MGKIVVEGARAHNLKNIDVEIPHDKLTVITGLSGSGKSTLAFDTIYGEGQRRYMETMSAYARQFFGSMERPDVDRIDGLSPVVAIEQKTTGKNPRSTVGTVTEINDFLRLLYARAATAYSYVTGEKMVRYSESSIAEMINERFAGRRIAVMAPLVKGRKGHYRDLFESILKRGYLYARIDGKMEEVSYGRKLDRYKIHDIELVIDRLSIDAEASAADPERLSRAIAEAMRQGKGTIMVCDWDTGECRYYSRNLMCPTSGISYNQPSPHTFSFNSPHGACPHCGGLGVEVLYDTEKIIPDGTLSIRQGGVLPLGKYKNNYTFVVIEALGKRHGFTLDDPIGGIGDEALSALINGDSNPLTIKASALGRIGGTQLVSWNGIADYIDRCVEEEFVSRGEKWRSQFVRTRPCSECGGARLAKESLCFRIDGLNIAEVCAMSVTQLKRWVDGLPEKLEGRERVIAAEVLKEVSERLGFLIDGGLGYLTLSRGAGTLSGGESQRIRLATQIGSKLVNVLYILDEPSIGLHQRDNKRLIDSLCNLRDAGNTVVVVEHDEEMMRAADWIIDIGPGAGSDGGRLMAQGPIGEILKSGSITADYLSGRRSIAVPQRRREGNGAFITIEGASGNNLKDITVNIPLGCMVCVTGVSGSGKSTLINSTLRPALASELYRSFEQPLPYRAIRGLENIDKMVVVDQSPIGRTPRSTPATYTNVMTDIRKLFESTVEAKVRGFKADRFSFNTKGGRCEECRGAGLKVIEMNFLPDVYVKCECCGGKRYNRETLSVRYKGRSIADVLDMTVDEALAFFEAIPSIRTKLKGLSDVGLGYLTLGQSSTTLSGGESQRVKLAGELSKRDTGRTLYILDEPTTGLHFEDIRALMQVLDRLADKGNTVLIIEHNMDVIKCCDRIIDMGPEGGDAGGKVIATGTPEEIASSKGSL
ncbi:MAG: excinuclease ABC subunit UvrA, partial [Rikenellaceae bacterium]|nr:excinuclease ABC subunit UvrA [Rikenellaceae bacterium]